MNSGKSWSISLGMIRGIPIKVHFSFFLFLLWIGFDEFLALGDPLQEVIFVIAVFCTILLHELGHALAALRFGIQTNDITLYPFGGIATLRPTREALTPNRELIIAIAGPLVNFAIAALTYLAIRYIGVLTILGGTIFWERFLYTNLFLGVFNLVPAYPMDGGRVLRATLSIFIGRTKATRISVRVAQVISLIFGLLAVFYGQAMLAVISVFVFLTAAQEDFVESTKPTVSHLKIKDVLIGLDNLVVLRHGMTVKQALEVALRSFQTIFPVLGGSGIIGIISKEALIQSQALDEEQCYIAEITLREFARANIEDPFEDVFNKFNSGEYPRTEPVLVFNGSDFCGFIYYPNLIEFLMLYGVKKPERSDF